MISHDTEAGTRACRGVDLEVFFGPAEAPAGVAAGAALLALLVVVLAGCVPPDGTTATPGPGGDAGVVWVVDSIGYHGPRGGGQYYLLCVPEDAAGADPQAPGLTGAFTEVPIAVDDGAYESGDRCPAGGHRRGAR
ncbi:MAG TPA: hypothetical protein VFQ77_08500 [Pseudonocardiaceae bacterium]|nr:hypothetical protein [Pseudonocardiaceae bacterium]